MDHSKQPSPPSDLAGYLEELTRTVFQPGLSWRVIEATVENAGQLIRLDREHGGFTNYLRAQPSVPAAVADLRRHVKFLGEMSGVHFLWSVGHPIPDELMCAPVPSEKGRPGRPQMRPHA